MEVGVPAFGLGADGIEIDEPRLEQPPSHYLQRLIHPPVQLDLVVNGAQNLADGALFVDRWKGNLETPLINEAQIGSHVSGSGKSGELISEILALTPIPQETRIDNLRVKIDNLRVKTASVAEVGGIADRVGKRVR